MTPDPGADPVARYKELLGSAHRAARAQAERERDRVVDLVAGIAEAEREIAAAAKVEAEVTAEVAEWWKREMVALAEVKWLTPGRRPRPDPTARPERLQEYLDEIHPATEAVKDAVRRASSWFGR